MEQTLSVDSSLQITIDRLVEGRLQSLREELARELFSQIAGSQPAWQNANGASPQVASPSARWASASDALREMNQWTQRIVEPSSQTEVMMAFVQASAQYSGRCGLFVRKGEFFSLWRAEGFPEESTGNLKALAIPASKTGAFKDLIDNKQPVMRTRSADAIPVVLQMALGNSSDDFLHLFPIVVQGKLVAALYADSGLQAGSVEVSALEVLSRVTGLSLETCAARAASSSTASQKSVSVQASAHTAVEASVQTSVQDSVDTHRTLETHRQEEQTSQATHWQQPVVQVAQKAEPVPTPAPAAAQQPEPVSAASLMEQYLKATEPVQHHEPAPQSLYAHTESLDPVVAPARETVHAMEPSVSAPEPVASIPATWNEPASAPQWPQAAAPAEQHVVEQHHAAPVASISSAAASGAQAALPNLDSLADEERDAHKKAHRFARVAVQDLLSYHKNKIEQGRTEKNLYNVLKDDIDKTRENYRQRFGKTAARVFDYLHYELIAKLAAGDPSVLGEQYPGAEVAA